MALPRTLILGGARSGKSTRAEQLLAPYEDVLYVATGGTRDGDREWAQRVELHRERRPSSWRTAETCDLVAVLADRADGAPVLIDCLALWLTAVMDRCNAWDDAAWAAGGEHAVQLHCDELAGAWRLTERQVIAVSNEVGMGVVPATAAGRRFRDTLGRLNMAVADASERVLLVVAGQVLTVKPAVGQPTADCEGRHRNDTRAV
ncbi:bifunctional adenosylcobinamide kinase/adenosylcobinamide-phosphate guanylyltransferase [Saccharothrix sp. ST-888]|uniref:bifunctional adenosylcobinamide kinase/adenosylcobinamide-phosphate guanylyltransferase n=1 Tax=Saccharothrix sp. ST-888 TaxID=1427391 RepID=UPI0009E5AF4D|nr:bifunctional adenosylcobinamide kinase/adenosylcobinamide-phosphate guanylyltransferase [Saccharothrix sp. ST-888]